MANVYIEARPQGETDGGAIEDFMMEDQEGSFVQTFLTLRQAVHLARANGHAPFVPCIRDLNDKARREHWRSAYGIVFE